MMVEWWHFLIIVVVLTLLRGLKWFMLYRIVKQAMANIKLPKIDLGGLHNGEKTE